MKTKKIFPIVFVVVHLFFIFFQINKQSQFIKLSYDKQKLEQTLQEMQLKKQELKVALSALQNRSTIRNLALQQWGMKKISLNQIKKLHDGQQLEYPS